MVCTEAYIVNNVMIIFKAAILLVFIYFYAISATLSTHDSVFCEATGCAAISFTHGSGSKASENGLIICSLDHSFNDNIEAVCAVRGSSSDALPFIEKAALQWKSGSSLIDAGFISSRYGFDILYRPHSISNFLFDKPVLWDMYGFGAAYNRTFSGWFDISAASSINAKEAGQAHLLLNTHVGNLASSFLAGFQSYTMENQDNSFTGGLDVNFRHDSLRIHCTAKYVDYAGFGRSSNPTMRPGETITGFSEFSYIPVSNVTITAMSYYLKSRKRYYHEFFFEGAEVSWMFLRHIGFGGGCEWQKDDDIISLTPRLSALIVPYSGSTSIQLSVQSCQIDNAVTSYRMAGEIWFRL